MYTHLVTSTINYSFVFVQGKGPGPRNDNNTHANYESDNESEYSGHSKDIDYEISPLLRQHQHDETTNENCYEYDVIRIKHNCDNTIIKSEKSVLRKSQRNLDWLMENNMNSFELSKQTVIDEYAPSFKQNPSIFYSFYKIDVHHLSFGITKNGQKSRLAKLLRKKITRNKKRIKKKPFLFVTCNNDKKEDTQKVKHEDQKKEKPDCRKNCDDKKQKDNFNIPNKMLKDDETEIPEKNNDDKGIKVGNKKSSNSIERFHAKCSKYWKNISYVLSCTEIDNTMKDLPIIEEKKHKRKKKHKKCKDSSKKHHKSMNNEEVRQYRISTYLADRDWRKKTIYDKGNDDSSLTMHSEKKNEENETEVNHVSPVIADANSKLII